MRTLSTLFSLALLVGGAPACTDGDDDRPATREYVVATILAPSCGKAGCHSSLTNANGFAFDTLEAANKAFSGPVPPSRVLLVVRATGDTRMPIDGPLPDGDIELLERWVMGEAQ
jgi:hypothetical protein